MASGNAKILIKPKKDVKNKVRKLLNEFDWDQYQMDGTPGQRINDEFIFYGTCWGEDFDALLDDLGELLKGQAIIGGTSWNTTMDSLRNYGFYIDDNNKGAYCLDLSDEDFLEDSLDDEDIQELKDAYANEFYDEDEEEEEEEEEDLYTLFDFGIDTSHDSIDKWFDFALRTYIMESIDSVGINTLSEYGVQLSERTLNRIGIKETESRSDENKELTCTEQQKHLDNEVLSGIITPIQNNIDEIRKSWAKTVEKWQRRADSKVYASMNEVEEDVLGLAAERNKYGIELSEIISRCNNVLHQYSENDFTFENLIQIKQLLEKAFEVFVEDLKLNFNMDSIQGGSKKFSNEYRIDDKIIAIKRFWDNAIDNNPEFTAKLDDYNKKLEVKEKEQHKKKDIERLHQCTEAYESCKKNLSVLETELATARNQYAHLGFFAFGKKSDAKKQAEIIGEKLNEQKVTFEKACGDLIEAYISCGEYSNSEQYLGMLPDGENKRMLRRLIDFNKQLSDVKVNDVISFGKYYETNSHKESIEWDVLDVTDSKVLLFSKRVLDWRVFHESREFVTWESSNIRKWMREKFLSEAFTEEERRCIVDTELEDGVQDSIFLLSHKEIEQYYEVKHPAPAHSIFDPVCDTIEGPETQTTQYVRNNKEYFTLNNNNHCRWWLRTVNKTQSGYASVECVMYDSKLFIGSDLSHGHEGVRPAIWVKKTIQ